MGSSCLWFLFDSLRLLKIVRFICFPLCVVVFDCFRRFTLFLVVVRVVCVASDRFKAVDFRLFQVFHTVLECFGVFFYVVDVL